ncbi:hypothetical protein E4U41_000921 [Claviceps citrina]|nr:hypothetical protein E4U41_000921 [Claviceps citrina]
MLCNNRLYSLTSGILLLVILHPGHERMAKTLYFSSKFYEYLDVLAVRASGGHIDLHFAIHHLTTPYLACWRVMEYDDGWRVMAALNMVHHVLMYASFGGLAFCRTVLPVTGSTQLVVGLVGELWILWRKKMRMDEQQPLWPHWLSLCLLTVYFMLWLRDLSQRAKAPGQTPAPAQRRLKRCQGKTLRVSAGYEIKP